MKDLIKIGAIFVDQWVFRILEEWAKRCLTLKGLYSGLMISVGHLKFHLQILRMLKFNACTPSCVDCKFGSFVTLTYESCVFIVSTRFCLIWTRVIIWSATNQLFLLCALTEVNSNYHSWSALEYPFVMHQGWSFFFLTMLSYKHLSG